MLHKCLVFDGIHLMKKRATKRAYCILRVVVFHGFGGRLTVSDVGPTTVNKIMELCFKEIGLKKRDLNGQTPFGKNLRTFLAAICTLV